jgi:hydrogenase maturation factor
MEIEEKSRLLFMKYALPCAGTLVKRGNITQEFVDNLIETVKNSEPLPKNSEKIFKVAFSACSLIALDQKGKMIDADTIHQYYLFEHDVVIDKRYEEMGDFDPDACRIRAGVVQAVGNGFAVVANSAGKRKYRADYCTVKEGDTVVTHWNFVVEKINQKIAEKMRLQKIELNIK